MKECLSYLRISDNFVVIKANFLEINMTPVFEKIIPTNNNNQEGDISPSPALIAGWIIAVSQNIPLSLEYQYIAD